MTFFQMAPAKGRRQLAVEMIPQAAAKDSAAFNRAVKEIMHGHETAAAASQRICTACAFHHARSGPRCLALTGRAAWRTQVPPLSPAGEVLCSSYQIIET